MTGRKKPNTVYIECGKGLKLSFVLYGNKIARSYYLQESLPAQLHLGTKNSVLSDNISKDNYGP